MRILFFSLLLIIFSHEDFDENEVMIYKDLGKVNRGIAITIESFWSFKEYDIDSLKLSKTQSNQLFKTLSKIPGKSKENIYLIPSYAFKLFYRGKLDTLYIEGGFRRGYFTNANWEIEDKNGDLKKTITRLSKSFK